MTWCRKWLQKSARYPDQTLTSFIEMNCYMFSVTTWNLKGDDFFLDYFEQYSKPLSNVIYARYKFKCRTEDDQETLNSFIPIWKCCFMTVDIILILGIRYWEIILCLVWTQRKFLKTLNSKGSGLTLQKCTDTVRTFELS